MEKSMLISYFDQMASRWDEDFVRDADKLRCFATLSVTPGMRVLDVGCGTGGMVPYLLEHQPSSVTGVDFSPAMIELARQKFPQETVEFILDDVMDLDRGGAFDCVILNNTFPQFENRGSLTRHMHHLLAPGGRLMICHDTGRHQINAAYQKGEMSVSIPLPAAKTLAVTLSQYFEVDTLIDSTSMYVVSGIKKAKA